MREAPQVSRNGQWLKMMSGPPSNFITGPVKLPVVGSAHGHGELIADLPTERAKLGKAQVMGVWRYTAADEAGLLSDELEVLLVPDSLGLGEGQDAFVDRRSRLRPT